MYFSMFFQGALGIILAHVMGPKLLGLYAITLTAVGTVSLLLDVGQGYSVLTLLSEAYGKKDREEVRRVLRYYIQITLRWVMPMTVVLIIVVPFIAHLLLPKNTNSAFLVQIGLLPLLFSPFNDGVQLSLQCARRITSLAKTDVIYAFLDFLFPLTFIAISPTVTALLLGRLTAMIAKTMLSLTLWRRFFRNDPLMPTFRELRKPVSGSAKPLLSLGIWIALSRQSGKIIGYLPIYLLTAFATPTAVGQYNYLMSYLSFGSNFSGSINRLLGSILPAIYSSNPKGFRRAFWKANIGNMCVTLVIALPLLILGNHGLTFLYGKAFAVPSIVFLLLGITAFDDIVSGFGSYYRIHHALALSMLAQTISACVGLAVWSLTFRSLNPLVAIAVFGLASSITSKIGHVINFLYLEHRSAAAQLCAS
jgi:O-antigen/teichoic acid export membrane protein